MADLIFVTGGSRSGKSRYAQDRAEQIKDRRCFIATCVPADEEMFERVNRHRKMRSDADWDTIEEALDLAECFRGNPQYGVYLVDCLTLWVHNLMLHWNEQGLWAGEEQVEEAAALLLEEISRATGTAILVSGEVGWGIVPANDISRQFRDLVGICNQIVAHHAKEAVLVSCGLPFYLKKQDR